jgi:lambda family phage tail tape measure protein
MATEKIEIEIIAKGKPAEKAIKGVERKTKDLGKTSKKVGKEADSMLSKMKLGWIAVGASVVKAVSEAAKFERASIGLSKSQKRWAQEMSLATDIQAEQVAGFLKSAQTAGLAEDQMKELAKQSIALGYAFPHENAETLNDNMIMLAKTGEAQGFVVDILEQKYVGLGEDITTLDLKTKSWSEKMALVGEVAEKSQAQMDASKYKALNEMIGSVDQAFTDVGDTLVMLGSDSGGFGLIKKIIDGLSLSLQFIGAGIKTIATDIGVLFEALGIVHDRQTKTIDLTKEQLTVEEQLAKANNFKLELERELTIATGSHREAVERQIETITSQISNLKEYGDAHHDVKEQIDANKEAHAALKAEQDGMYEGVKDGLEDYIKAGKDAEAQQKEFGKVGTKIATSMEDAFVNMAMGVKTSFKDMARSIIADLIRIQVRKKITGFLGNLDFFGGGDTPAPAPKHTGGAIGLASIPSFHSGYRSDERLAKLQVGESVVNRAGTARNAQAIDAMNSGQAVGGGGDIQNANITFQVQAFDSASFQQGMVQNRATIVGVVREAFNRNGKSVAL